ncbi:diversity-generating retroelement protein bAvd family protein [Coraliomargarita sinensis]|uniref:Diversity-generating retroelement protein bAvd family protein n=1 Tax=Coraliomargarita sinensis TaxID=2174842 RepID=A0A317ZE69_9BACT|nr:four helix bundle protein [Coraliomargarita sinensis]PXA03685.1 diversity-generating retroelement protein bAvd family protein [Coraliomargarita sinensis]
MSVQNAKELKAYQLSYQLAMAVYELSKTFPSEEKYALISQIRRSSRSVPMNLREAWAKRRYKAHFVSKITDCDGECGETETSLDFAFDCGFISDEQHNDLIEMNNEVGRLLGAMLKNPSKWTLKS